MSGDVHMTVGAVTAVIVSMPKTIPEFLGAVAVGAVAGLFCDVDSKKSKGSRLLYGVLSTMITALIATCFVSRIFPAISIRNFVNSVKPTQLIGFSGFIFMALLGTKMPHRRVTHSIEYILITTIFVALVDCHLAFMFFISALTHPCLDVLNKRKVKVSLLFRLDIAFAICPSESGIGTLITTLSTVCLAIYPAVRFLV